MNVNNIMNINGKSIRVIQAFNGITRDISGNKYTEVFLYARDQNSGLLYFIPKTIVDDNKLIDNYKISISGFACNGDIQTYKYPKQYKIWTDMIYRCYSKTNSIYPYFGAIGTKCCTAWGCFEYFMRDWYYIKNFNAIYGSPRSVFVIDFIRNIDDIPKEDRIYKCDNTIIRKFYGSQVGVARNLVKEKNGTPFIPIRNYTRPKKIHDAARANDYCGSVDEPRGFNLIQKEVEIARRNNDILNATNKNVELKEMVTIVDKNKKNNQDKDKK